MVWNMTLYTTGGAYMVPRQLPRWPDDIYFWTWGSQLSQGPNCIDIENKISPGLFIICVVDWLGGWLIYLFCVSVMSVMCVGWSVCFVYARTHTLTLFFFLPRHCHRKDWK